MESTLPRDCSREKNIKIPGKHTNHHSPYRQPPNAHPAMGRRTGREPARVGLLRETLSHRHHQGSAYPSSSYFPLEPCYEDPCAISMSRIGWGHFTITAKVFLKAVYSWASEDAKNSPGGAAKGSLPLERTLDFDGFGGKRNMGRCQLKVRTTENRMRTRSRRGIS